MGVLWGTRIGQFFFSIRKQHSVDKVSMSRGVVFSYSFSIYCAAYHCIWCSEYHQSIKVDRNS